MQGRTRVQGHVRPGAEPRVPAQSVSRPLRVGIRRHQANDDRQGGAGVGLCCGMCGRLRLGATRRLTRCHDTRAPSCRIRCTPRPSRVRGSVRTHTTTTLWRNRTPTTWLSSQLPLHRSSSIVARFAGVVVVVVVADAAFCFVELTDSSSRCSDSRAIK